MNAAAIENRSPSTTHLDDPSVTSGSPLDQVSSLRAAALSTLRSKRRKPGMEKLSISRPPPPESIQLDYGHEEESHPEPASKSTSSSASSASATNVLQGNAKQHEVVPEDVQMREEGEISEEEDDVPAPQVPNDIRSSSPFENKPTSVKSSSPLRNMATPGTTKQTYAIPSRTPEPLPVPHLSPRHRSSTPGVVHAHLSPAQRTILSLDVNHVRPGLKMNQPQYEAAKDIILDLLGWGVPPEYLVDCGLSKEIVFYVFTELNLRLPQNLDKAGLIPYTPEAVASACQAAILLPQAETPNHSLLPTKSPSVKSAAAPSNQPDTSSVTTMAEFSLSSSNLHDIEMQRRQELLARKKQVIASRKLKQLPLSINLTILPEGVEPTQFTTDEAMTTVVPADVDDFLKSISPAKEENTSTSIAHISASSHSDDIMDVDDIPGLGGSHSVSSIPTSPRPAKLSQPVPPVADRAISPANSSHSLAETPNSLVESSDSLSSSVGSSMKEYVYKFAKHDYQAVRRGSKRPVASDFVDLLDLHPRFGGTNYHSGGASLNPIARRKAAVINFGGVSSSHRRCVIDLSDSEEETEDVLRIRIVRDRDGAEQRSSVASPGSSGMRDSTERATPPVISFPGVIHGGIKEPSLLELEIQKMKELIEKKEQARRRKLAERIIPHRLEDHGVAEGTSEVKQEEADSALRSKSPIPDDSTMINSYSNNNGPTAYNGMNIIESFNEQPSSVVSVAAALATASTSVSALTTPPIGSLVSRFFIHPTSD
ncbi:hypothetical protein AX17_006283 [Amanita inopinata Kibby_2008]|nr:hypothetical protein AX17_006283 [Amanita inopinata Kibby_2008]